MNYSVNIDSLHKNFPADCQVPSLLLDFGCWLESKRAQSVGCFSLQSERFNDYWIENGADLHPYFAFFICDCTGGQIGYWLYDERTTVSPPIVLVGSEGELSILSDTLQEFLKRLAEGSTQADDLDSRDEGGTERAELTKWLESRTAKSAIQNVRVLPDLKGRMDEWGEQQRDWIDKDPFHLQIADKLRKFVKPNAKPWETSNFDVLLVGTHSGCGTDRSAPSRCLKTKSLISNHFSVPYGSSVRKRFRNAAFGFLAWRRLDGRVGLAFAATSWMNRRF